MLRRSRGRRSLGRVLADREARHLLLFGFVARLREGGIGLALVLLVEHVTGSFAIAGAVSAVFYASAAAARPVQGRWMDRAGPSPVLAITAVANAALLLAAAAVSATGSVAPLIGLVAAAGASMPALSAALRMLWPDVLPERVDAAFALDSLGYELAIVIGPALVGLICAVLAPALAVVVLAVAGLAGTLAVSAAPAARARGSRRSGKRPRERALTRSIRQLLVVAFLVGMAEGPLTVSFAAAADRGHHPGASGPLVSALAIGNVLGALYYGARAWTASLPTRLFGYTLGLAVGLGALAVAAANLATLAVVAVLVGVVLAPTITSIALCVNAAAPQAARGEAFAWISLATPCGAAAAQAVAGVLAAGPGPRWSLLVGAVGAGAAALGALSHRRVSTRPSDAISRMETRIR